MAFNKWFDTFIEEKGIDTDQKQFCKNRFREWQCHALHGVHGQRNDKGN